MLRRSVAVFRHELALLRRDPSPLALVVMPLVLMAFLKPAFRFALAATDDPGANGAEQAVPGAAVTFSLFWVTQVGIVFMREHAWGTWQRLRATPSRPFEIALGKAFPTFVVIAAQLAVVFAGGGLLFDLDVGGPIAALVPVGASFALCLVALGVALVALCRTFNQLATAANVGAMIMAGVGGALTPLSVLPGWARVVAPVTPTYWAMVGFREVILDGGGVRDVVVPIGVLLAFSVCFAFLATRFFRFSDAKIYSG